MKNYLRFVTIFRSTTLFSLVVTLLLTACENTEESKPSHFPTLSKIVGAWEADGYRWDLEGNGLCYLMNEAGDDFAYDENGDYIYLSVKSYCEQYARDYNADPANTIKGTPEDFATHDYEGTSCFTNINVTEREITIWSGQHGNIVVLCVKGTYVYDRQSGIMTVQNVAIADETTTLKIQIWESAGHMHFRYSDMDMYGTPNYDKTKNYTVIGPMIFYCKPGTPYRD